MKRVLVGAGLASAIVLGGPAHAQPQDGDLVPGAVLVTACVLGDHPDENVAAPWRALCAGYAAGVLDIMRIYEPHYMRCVPQVKNKIAQMNLALRDYLEETRLSVTTRLDAFAVVMNVIDHTWPCPEDD